MNLTENEIFAARGKGGGPNNLVLKRIAERNVHWKEIDINLIII
jgi:hypothetical protein